MGSRIICGEVYEPRLTGRYKISGIEFANGQMEMTARAEVVYEEDETRDAERLANLRWKNEELPEVIKEREERSRIKAVQRARRTVRHLCKAIGADTMLTFTYRENQTDLSLMKRHINEFNRRLWRLLPDFVGVATFEPQKRGAWHCHMATTRIASRLLDARGYRVKSYDLLRSVWRSVTKSLGGTVNVRKPKGASQHSPARIAAYMSKYMAKMWEHIAPGANRFSRFGKVGLPRRVHLGYVENLHEAICVCYGFAADDQRVTGAFLPSFKDSFWIAFERVPQSP